MNNKRKMKKKKKREQRMTQPQLSNKVTSPMRNADQYHQCAAEKDTASLLGAAVENV
jgi:hypothetical protein